MGNVYKKFVCVCGKEFNDSGTYGAHVRFCNEYKLHKENLKKKMKKHTNMCVSVEDDSKQQNH